MRLGERRRIHIRVRRQKSKKLSAALFFIFLLLLLICLFFYFFKAVRPMLCELAKNEARNLACDAIDRVIAAKLDSAALRYDDLIRLTKDENGAVRAAESELGELGRFKSELALGIQQEIASTEEKKLTIPLGSFFGNGLFVGVGPKLSMRVMPYGNTQIEFCSSFESVGINQSRLAVDLLVRTKVGFLMPALVGSCEVEDRIPILQSIIVGEVPETYVELSQKP